MLLCAIAILLLLNVSSSVPTRSDTEAAAEQIHYQIFGGDSSYESARYSEHSAKNGAARIVEPEERVQTFAQLKRLNLDSAPATRHHYAPPPSDKIPIIKTCQDVKCHMTFVVVMDSSGSVGRANWQKELTFVKTLLQVIAVKAHVEGVKVCTGLVSYSTKVHVEVDPCCESTICRIVDQFGAGSFRYRGDMTNTNDALKVTRQMLQGPRSYRKVAILITDGRSNTGGDPVPTATLMRTRDRAGIVALGVTSNINTDELKGISGSHIVTKIEGFAQFGPLAAGILGLSHVNHLNTQFSAICRQDTSQFQATCARCSWGEWSTCKMDWSNDQCQQRKSCAVGGTEVKHKTQICTCPLSGSGKLDYGFDIGGDKIYGDLDALDEWYETNYDIGPIEW